MKNTQPTRNRAKTTPTDGMSTPNPDKVMAIQVRRLPIDNLKEHPRNKEVRNHPEPGSPEWDVMVSSLSHDYFDPMVWNQRNGQLVSGHLRRKVMQSMGVTEVDVVVVDYDEPTHIARLLAANNLIGQDDKKGMKSFLTELVSIPDFDLNLTGFSTESLASKFKFDVSSHSTETSPKNKVDDENDGSSTANYKSPSDSVPLVLSFSPSDHIEVMSLLRAIRKDVAAIDGTTMGDVSNSDAIFRALQQYTPKHL
jgi:hypothetical protein